MVFVIHWQESAMVLHVFPIPILPPTSLSTRFPWVFPVHQVRALVLCIQPGLVICFTLDNIHVSMLSSWNIPPSPSPTESKSLFYTSVSLFKLISSKWKLSLGGGHIYCSSDSVNVMETAPSASTHRGLLPVTNLGPSQGKAVNCSTLARQVVKISKPDNSLEFDTTHHMT